MSDPYTILGVVQSASAAEIKKAYLLRANEKGGPYCHPDKGGSVASFQLLVEAYEKLSDPANRVQRDLDRQAYELQKEIEKVQEERRRWEERREAERVAELERLRLEKERKEAETIAELKRLQEEQEQREAVLARKQEEEITKRREEMERYERMRQEEEKRRLEEAQREAERRREEEKNKSWLSWGSWSKSTDSKPTQTSYSHSPTSQPQSSCPHHCPHCHVVLVCSSCHSHVGSYHPTQGSSLQNFTPSPAYDNRSYYAPQSIHSQTKHPINYDGRHFANPQTMNHYSAVSTPHPSFQQYWNSNTR